MLEGTDVHLRILVPDINTLAARTAQVEIDDDAIEFDNTAYYDLNGDPYYVVPAQLDISGARISYTVIGNSGWFADVDDETGFNGYAITLLGLRQDPSMRIHSIKVIDALNTLEIPARNLSFTSDTVLVNVDGLPYQTGEGVVGIIGFRITGTAVANIIKGDEGDDLLLGLGGPDRLSGLAGADVIRGGVGADQLAGGLGADQLWGGMGGDLLAGGMGRDLLAGGVGRDVLDGGLGADRLIGGYGADVFVFSGRFG
ncbi:hypothetical protein FNJ84_03395 [Paracoccus sp. M683]|uniref:calcium-binding protein n=1 Tax=Paracoccus sp. M683 TaxID=2594268 RepID=UPI00117F3FBC|nr:hypothetical protein [Paracoccus sp. M683]TRW98616.1 hypothetical protein FNJ84_03395 [Paracoccus sp. M683]